MGAPGIRFYENGVMSLNLPMTAQVVGTAATRSTHPGVLADMTAFLGSALERECPVDNPFHLKTKSQVIRQLEANDHADLIELAHTCSNVRHRVPGFSHCGVCVQCLHRRFGVLAVGLENRDRPDKFAFDLFESSAEGRDRTMLMAFVDAGRRWSTMSLEDFVREHSMHLARLPPNLRGPEAWAKVQNLHRQHGEDVMRVIESGLVHYGDQLAKGLMPAGSLLPVVIGDQPGVSPTTPLESQPEVQPPEIELIVDKPNLKYAVANQPPHRAPAAVGILDLLAKTHASDRAERRKPDAFRYVTTERLCADLHIDPSALSKRVSEIRKAASTDLQAAGHKPDRYHDVVQSAPDKGYRLNPRLRLIAPSWPSTS